MMFKRNLTKWTPFGNYSHGSDNYIVLARKNTKTGMIYFKVKNINRFKYSNIFVPNDLIDVKKAFKYLLDNN